MTMSCGHCSSELQRGEVHLALAGSTRLLEVVTMLRRPRRGRAGGTGGARRNRAALAAERHGLVQCCRAIQTCAGRAVGVCTAAGVDAGKGRAGGR